MKMSETLEVLDRRWRNACRVVFKQDVGPLFDYIPWLSEFANTPILKKSDLSGKEVTFAFDDYAEGAGRVSFDEIDFKRKFEPLGINEVKDIDSIVEALEERFAYAGNVILGNCGNLERCSNVYDSFYMHGVLNLGDSRYMLGCSFGRLNEDCFGTYGPGESSFCIRCTQTYREKRCFEVWNSQNTSDSYYSYGLDNCSDCIFCFSLENRGHSVGNLKLEKSKYEAIKSKLLEEISEKLGKEKRLPSLIDIAEKAERPKLRLPGAEDFEKYWTGDKSPVEREFSKTTKLVLGKELKPIDDYREWLKRHTHRIEERTSVASGKRLLMLPSMIAIPEIPHDRIVSLGEAKILGERASLNEEEAEGLTLANAHERIGRLAFFKVDIREGANSNVPECSACVSSSNCYHSSGIVYAKHCGYTFWPRSTQNAFGCDSMTDSSFCINCYRSVKLTRCFEMDTCRTCSDSLFCHNCEKVDNSMFSFNAKSLRNAIGNAPLPRDKYEVVRSSLLGQIGEELEKNKDLKWDIFNIGRRR